MTTYQKYTSGMLKLFCDDISSCQDIHDAREKEKMADNRQQHLRCWTISLVTFMS